MINPFNRQAIRERNVRLYETGNPLFRVGYLGVHPTKWHAAQDKVDAVLSPIFYGMIGAILVGVIAGAANAGSRISIPILSAAKTTPGILQPVISVPTQILQ